MPGGRCISSSLEASCVVARSYVHCRPWRPRDLEALLSRFNLLSDLGYTRRPPNASHHSDAADHSHSVLSYEGFLNFWDETGLKDLLGEVRLVALLSCLAGSSLCELSTAQVRKQGTRGGSPSSCLPLQATHDFPNNTK